MKITMHTDGGLKPGPNCCYVIRDEDGMIIKQAAQKLPEGTTVPECEYAGILMGMYEAQRLGATHVEAFMDAQLIVRQITGQYACRAENLVDFHSEARRLAKTFPKFRLRHIPREQNEVADALGRTAYD